MKHIIKQAHHIYKNSKVCNYTNLAILLLSISILALSVVIFIISGQNKNIPDSELRFSELSNNKKIIGSILPASCESNPFTPNGDGNLTDCQLPIVWSSFDKGGYRTPSDAVTYTWSSVGANSCLLYKFQKVNGAWERKVRTVVTPSYVLRFFFFGTSYTVPTSTAIYQDFPLSSTSGSLVVPAEDLTNNQGLSYDLVCRNAVGENLYQKRTIDFIPPPPTDTGLHFFTKEEEEHMKNGTGHPVWKGKEFCFETGGYDGGPGNCVEYGDMGGVGGE